MTIKQHFLRFGLGSLLISGLALAGSSDVLAKHQWEEFHLLKPSDTDPALVTVNFYNDNLFARPKYLESIGEWNVKIGNTLASDCTAGVATTGGDVIADCVDDPTALPTLSVIQGNATFNPNGDSFLADFTTRMQETDEDLTPGTPTFVNSFDGNYGNTGILGVAIIDDGELLTGATTHIIYGEVYINECYGGLSGCGQLYLSDDDRKYVFCQEFGHVLGLDHVKKDTQTCMYTPRGLNFFGSTSSPNVHDGEQVNDNTHSESEHTTGDSGDGGDPKPCNPRKPGCTTASPTVLAFWAERFENEEDMFGSADAVVSATVLKGSTFDRSVGAAGASLPISQVVLQVNETYKGFTKAVILLEQARGSGFEIEDDPGYVRGDDYVLYLRTIDSNTYRVVGPDGRIRQ